MNEGHETPERRARRAAMATLAACGRRLTDAMVQTDLPAAQLDAIAAELDRVTQHLLSRQHDGPYSGLLPKERDYRRPGHAMPLSPIVGDCSPIRPDVELRIEGERVVGSARLGKKFVGPAHCAHGGVTAMICDQIVAHAARAAGFRALTAELSVRYRRPTPLYREIELRGHCEPRSERRAAAFAELRVDGEVVVEAEARMALAPGWATDGPRRAAPAVE